MLVDERADVEERAGRAVKVGEAALGDRAIACDIDDLAVTEGHVFLDVERSLVPLDLDEARGVDREIEAVAAPLAMVLDRGTVGMGLAERIAPGDAKIVSRLEGERSEEHTSELQSLMRISYAVFCLKKKQHTNIHMN